MSIKMLVLFVENICNNKKYLYNNRILCRLLRAAVLPVPDAQDREQPEQVGGAVLPAGLLLPLPTRPATQTGDQAQVGNIVIVSFLSVFEKATIH